MYTWTCTCTYPCLLILNLQCKIECTCNCIRTCRGICVPCFFSPSFSMLSVSEYLTLWSVFVYIYGHTQHTHVHVQTCNLGCACILRDTSKITCCCHSLKGTAHSEDSTLALSFISDITVLLTHPYHDTLCVCVLAVHIHEIFRPRDSQSNTIQHNTTHPRQSFFKENMS